MDDLRPPPTSNRLDLHQRARLVRSTRKLAALLGTTPHLLELDADACTTKRARRHASVFSVFPLAGYAGSSTSLSSSSASSRNSSSASSRNSSVTSFALDPASQSRSSCDSAHSSSRSRRSTDTARPRPLVLRLNAIPVAPSDPRLPASPLPLTPTTAQALQTTLAFPADDAPLTPAPPTPSAVRRRTMAKLARTLGENVPSELVFARTQAQVDDWVSTPRAPRSPALRRMASASVDGFVRGRPTSQAWVTGTRGWQGEWNRNDIRDVQQALRNLRLR